MWQSHLLLRTILQLCQGCKIAVISHWTSKRFRTNLNLFTLIAPHNSAKFTFLHILIQVAIRAIHQIFKLILKKRKTIDTSAYKYYKLYKQVHAYSDPSTLHSSAKSANVVLCRLGRKRPVSRDSNNIKKQQLQTAYQFYSSHDTSRRFLSSSVTFSQSIVRYSRVRCYSSSLTPVNAPGLGLLSVARNQYQFR